MQSDGECVCVHWRGCCGGLSLSLGFVVVVVRHSVYVVVLKLYLAAL